MEAAAGRVGRGVDGGAGAGAELPGALELALCPCPPPRLRSSSLGAADLDSDCSFTYEIPYMAAREGGGVRRTERLF